MIDWNLLLPGTRVRALVSINTHDDMAAEPGAVGVVVENTSDNGYWIKAGPLAGWVTVFEIEWPDLGDEYSWLERFDCDRGGPADWSIWDLVEIVEDDEPETADEYHARTGEPWGAGEDTFERAMRAAYPERGAR